MSNSAISINGIGKRYLLGTGGGERYRLFRDAIANGVKGLFRNEKGQNNLQEFWALKDLSFDIEEGESVAIIGRNGAGKSTLLKILSQITSPTEGEARVRGRIASLLEVGTGFHPELSGRENIYLNAAILGMRRVEINNKFNAIVDFSEIGKFLDTPVKRYSSGMYIRLAFAVAAHLDPEILLVDEVLAVGDAVFQKRCLGKMKDVAKTGRTVLFVSHNMTAVQNLCQRAIWLDQGKVKIDGATSSVVFEYYKNAFSTETEGEWADMSTAPGNDQVRLRKVSIKTVDDPLQTSMTIQMPLVLEFEYWNLVQGSALNLTLAIYSDQGVCVFNTASNHEPVWHGKPFPKGLFRSSCYIPKDLLNDGFHTVTLLMVKNSAEVIYMKENALTFELIDNTPREWHGKWPGAVRPNLKWSTELINES